MFVQLRSHRFFFQILSLARYVPNWEECLQAVSDEGQTARDMVEPAKIVSNADYCGLDHITIHLNYT